MTTDYTLDIDRLMDDYGLKLVHTKDDNIIYQNAWPERTDFDARLTLFMKAVREWYEQKGIENGKENTTKTVR